ncbi:MAG: GDSL family lipase [Oscillochloris sp.]|nr:GDSL family lipase [Oscillochloris sp.]
MHRTDPPPGGATVFYGSSSLRLWTTLADDLAPWPVVNRAFGGSTLAACVHFFERLVPPCAPGALVFYAGDNDLGDGQNADMVIGSLQALLTRIDAQLPAIPVAFLAIKPSPARRALRPAIRQVNETAQRLLSARSRGLFIDTYYPMLQHDGEPCPALFADDGLHLSAAGYQLWAQILGCYRLSLFEGA